MVHVMIDTPKTIAEIELELAQRGVLQADFYRMANISRQAWHKWRIGRFEPRQSTMRKINLALAEVRKTTRRNTRKGRS